MSEFNELKILSCLQNMQETNSSILLCLRNMQETMKEMRDSLYVLNHDVEYLCGGVSIIEQNSTVSLTDKELKKIEEIHKNWEKEANKEDDDDDDKDEEEGD